MTSFVYLKFAVLFLHLSWVGFAQENSTLSTPGKIGSNLNMTTSNLTNTSTVCKLRVDKSAVEDILRMMHNYATHVVEIKVFVNSRNGKQIFPELIWPWASEIGRTIISMKARTIEFYANFTISSLHFITLTPGIKQVNMVVFEENYGCLPNGSNGTERVFDFLLHQIFHFDNTHDYKLCRRAFSNDDDLKQYNCCRVASGGKVKICAEYSSIILEYAGYYINVMTFLMLYVAFPLIREYLHSFSYEREHYEITDSPMALSTILSTIFIERSKSPVKSHYRRLAFSVTVSVIICTSVLGWGWTVFLSVWTFIFTFWDFFGINDTNNTKNNKKAEIKINADFERYLSLLTLPFNIKYWWDTFKSKWPLTNQEQTGQSTNQQQPPEQNPQSPTPPGDGPLIYDKGKQFGTDLCFGLIYLIVFCFIWPLSILSIPAMTWLTIVRIQYEIMFDKIKKRKNLRCFIMCMVHIMLPVMLGTSFLVIGLFLVVFFNLALYLITGLYLNGSFYSPIVVPLLVLLGYFWKNWRSFVETKYLLLKTKIIQVCKDKYGKRKEKENKSNTTRASTTFPTTSSTMSPTTSPTMSPMTCSTTSSTTSSSTSYHTDPQYTVDIDKNRVSKVLYDKIRERIFPYSKVLFSFFVRMFFVANFCLVVFVLMLVAQKSNIAAPVQIISTIAASTFPLIFDAIWADHTFEQKDVNGKKLEQQIAEIVQIETKKETPIITVKVVGKGTNMDDIINDIKNVCRLRSTFAAD